MSVISQYNNKNGDRLIQGTVNSFFKESTLVNTSLPIGTGQVECLSVTLPSGLYYMKLQINLEMLLGTTIEELAIILKDEDGNTIANSMERVTVSTIDQNYEVQYRLTKVVNLKDESSVFTGWMGGIIGANPITVISTSKFTVTKIGL